MPPKRKASQKSGNGTAPKRVRIASPKAPNKRACAATEDDPPAKKRKTAPVGFQGRVLRNRIVPGFQPESTDVASPSSIARVEKPTSRSQIAGTHNKTIRSPVQIRSRTAKSRAQTPLQPNVSRQAVRTRAQTRVQVSHEAIQTTEPAARPGRASTARSRRSGGQSTTTDSSNTSGSHQTNHRPLQNGDYSGHSAYGKEGADVPTQSSSDLSEVSESSFSRWEAGRSRRYLGPYRISSPWQHIDRNQPKHATSGSSNSAARDTVDRFSQRVVRRSPRLRSQNPLPSSGSLLLGVSGNPYDSSDSPTNELNNDEHADDSSRWESVDRAVNTHNESEDGDDEMVSGSDADMVSDSADTERLLAEFLSPTTQDDNEASKGGSVKTGQDDSSGSAEEGVAGSDSEQLEETEEDRPQTIPCIGREERISSFDEASQDEAEIEPAPRDVEHSPGDALTEHKASAGDRSSLSTDEEFEVPAIDQKSLSHSQEDYGDPQTDNQEHTAPFSTPQENSPPVFTEKRGEREASSPWEIGAEEALQASIRDQVQREQSEQSHQEDFVQEQISQDQNAQYVVSSSIDVDEELAVLMAHGADGEEEDFAAAIQASLAMESESNAPNAAPKSAQSEREAFNFAEEYQRQEEEISKDSGKAATKAAAEGGTDKSPTGKSDSRDGEEHAGPLSKRKDDERWYSNDGIQQAANAMVELHGVIEEAEGTDMTSLLPYSGRLLEALILLAPIFFWTEPADEAVARLTRHREMVDSDIEDRQGHRRHKVLSAEDLRSLEMIAKFGPEFS